MFDLFTKFTSFTINDLTIYLQKKGFFRPNGEKRSLHELLVGKPREIYLLVRTNGKPCF